MTVRRSGDLLRPFIVLLAAGALGGCASVRAHADASHTAAGVRREQAEDPAPDQVVADRQSLTEGAEILEGGRLQVEVGDRFVHQGAGGASHGDGEAQESNAVGEVLVRLAVGTRSEVRVGLGSLLQTTSHGEHHTGRTDGSVGAKLLLAPESHEHAWLPSAALVLETSLPTGSRELRHAAVDPEAKLALGWALPRGWHLASNVNVARAHGQEHAFTEWAYGAVVTHRVAHSVRGIAEVFTRRPEDSAARSVVAAGAAIAVGRSFELDAEVGHGIGAARHDYFLSLGAAHRW